MNNLTNWFPAKLTSEGSRSREGTSLDEKSLGDDDGMNRYANINRVKHFWDLDERVILIMKMENDILNTGHLILTETNFTNHSKNTKFHFTK